MGCSQRGAGVINNHRLMARRERDREKDRQSGGSNGDMRECCWWWPWKKSRYLSFFCFWGFILVYFASFGICFV